MFETTEQIDCTCGHCGHEFRAAPTPIHLVLCGDSTDPETWSRLGIARAGTLCFTSPPYNLGSSVALSGNKMRAKDGNAYDDHDDQLDPEKWLTMVEALLKNATRHCEAAVFNVQPLAGNRKAIWRWLADRADSLCDVVTWDKGHAAPQIAQGVLASRYEWLCVFGSANASRRIPLSSWQGTLQSVYSGPPQRNNEYASIHAATFPVHLPAFVMSTLCDQTRMVVDCCCGTGTTIVAAEMTGRRAIGIDTSPRYIDCVVERWQNLTKKKAVLAEK